MQTLKKLIKEFLDNFDTSRPNFYKLKKDTEWQMDIVYKCHMGRLPDNRIYKQIYHTLLNFAELPDDADIDDYREAVNNIEPDVYTSDLTEWLNENITNIYYLTEAINSGVNDGFHLLAVAQQLFYQEIANILLEELHKMV